TIHRMGSREIALDLRDDFLLCAGQFEWKRRYKLVEQNSVPTVSVASANRHVGSSRRDQYLHCKEFREDQMLAGGISLLPMFREMDCANCRRACHLAADECRRQ